MAGKEVGASMRCDVARSGHTIQLLGLQSSARSHSSSGKTSGTDGPGAASLVSRFDGSSAGASKASSGVSSAASTCLSKSLGITRSRKGMRDTTTVQTPLGQKKWDWAQESRQWDSRRSQRCSGV